MYLYDTLGEKYLDMFAGIAVSALGHSHPRLVDAICEQAKKVIHTSSSYYIQPQALLAKRLVELSCADRVFFANSGAEANEAAIKLTRFYHNKKGSSKYEIITLLNSFHGRTVTTISATGQEKFQQNVHPLTPRFTHVPINDYNALTQAISDKTAAIMLEPIQGESGVHSLTQEYLERIRDLCNKNDILLIFDEIQTGIGRTGKMFAYEHSGVQPDIFTLAKALGGGVPIGAVCAKQAVCSFEPGDHGSTFGGNHLATAAALETLQIIEDENLVENSEKMGEYLRTELLKLFKNVRGQGLMIGIEIESAQSVKEKLLAQKVLVGAVGNNTLRLLPPLVISKKHVDEFINKLKLVI